MHADAQYTEPLRCVPVSPHPAHSPPRVWGTHMYVSTVCPPASPGPPFRDLSAQDHPPNPPRWAGEQGRRALKTHIAFAHVRGEREHPMGKFPRHLRGPPFMETSAGRWLRGPRCWRSPGAPVCPSFDGREGTHKMASNEVREKTGS